jgi:hypothetical protein
MYLLWYHKKIRPSFSIYYSLVWCFECYYCYHRLIVITITFLFSMQSFHKSKTCKLWRGYKSFHFEIYYLVPKSLGITILNIVLLSYYSVMILMLFLWQFSILSLSYFITKFSQINLTLYIMKSVNEIIY